MRQDRAPVPCCTVDPGNLAAAAERLIHLIRLNHRNRGCSTFVYVDPALNAYAIAEDRSIAMAWVRPDDAGGHFGWLVGRYDPPGRGRVTEYLALTPEGVAEDLECHLQDLVG